MILVSELQLKKSSGNKPEKFQASMGSKPLLPRYYKQLSYQKKT